MKCGKFIIFQHFPGETCTPGVSTKSVPLAPADKFRSLEAPAQDLRGATQADEEGGKYVGLLES